MSRRTQGSVSRFISLKLLLDEKVVGDGNQSDMGLPARPAPSLEVVQP